MINLSSNVTLCLQGFLNNGTLVCGCCNFAEQKIRDEVYSDRYGNVSVYFLWYSHRNRTHNTWIGFRVGEIPICVPFRVLDLSGPM